MIQKNQLRQEMGVACVFIGHEKAVVDNLTDLVAVIHLGRSVEMGRRAQVFGNPHHPCTRRRIEPVPVPDPAS